MTPAIAGGDHIVMEGFTYLTRKPARGDIVVFRANGIPPLEDGMTYVKRVVGLPGERIRISEGALYINESIVELKNKEGAIRYANWPSFKYLSSSNDNIVIPSRDYFLLGRQLVEQFGQSVLGTTATARTYAVVCRMLLAEGPPKTDCPKLFDLSPSKK